jgi:amino acid adenylation domain-containing protein
MLDQLVAYPISHAQQRILHIERLFPGTPIHNLTGTAIYNIELDFNLLSEACNLFVKNNDASRTRFFVNEDEEVIQQYVVDYKRFEVEVIDFSKGDLPEMAFQSWLKDQTQEVLDWKGQSLIRFKFFRIKENQTGYFVNVHHAIADGWSIQLLTSFISNTYTQLLQNGEVDKVSYPSYLDYLAKEQEYLHSKRFERDKNFWRNRLKNLPSDFHVYTGHKTEGEQVIFKVDQALVRKMRDFASKHKISLPILITGLVILQQYKFKSRRTIGVGLPIFNHTGINKNCFGMMTSTLPLLIHVSPHLSVADYFDLIQGESRKSLLCQRFPYELILKEYQQIQPGASGLFDICFNYYNTELGESTAIVGASAQVFEKYTGHQVFPLYLVAKEWSENGQMEFAFNYKTSLYTLKEVEQIYHDMMELFDQVCQHTDSTIERLTLHQSQLPDSEEANQMLFENLTSPEINPVGIKTCFPRKSEKLVIQSRKMVTVPYSLTIREANSFDKITKEYNFEIDTVFSTLILDLLRRYNQDQEAGIGLLQQRLDKKTQVELAFIRCQFEMEDSLSSIMKKVSRIIENKKSEPLSSDSKVEVLCYIGGKATLNLVPDSIYNIALGLTEHQDKLFLNCTYNVALFDAAVIDNICLHFEELLKVYLHNPNLSLHQYSLLPENDRELLLKKFNNTKAPLPKQVSIIEQFESWAKTSPNTVALKWENGEITYAELNNQVDQLAGTLVSLGVKIDSVVPIMVDRSLELLVGIFGILKAGGAYLPIDPAYPMARINFILKDCDASILLTTSHNKPSHDASYKCVLLDDPSVYHVDKNVVKVPKRSSEDLAYVIYTSGSTGNPKGVMVSHLAALNRIEWMQHAYPIGSEDVILQKTSASFDVSVWELFWWSMKGASCYLLEPGGEREPEKICQAIQSAKVTTIHFVPSMLSAFLHFLEEEAAYHNLTSLRYVFASGEELKPTTVNHFNKLLPHARLINLYGPTEAAIDVSYYNLTNQTFCDQVLIGKPIDNILLYILNPDLTLQPIGMAGELCIAGVGLARGYLNKAELTAENFVENPFSPGQKLYKTGDLARWLPSGELEYLGRMDHQVKFHGNRIELREIDITLSKYPSVEDAITLVVDDVSGHQMLCAYITPKNGHNLDDLRAYLEQWLPAYMIPSRIIPLEKLPLTPNGKVDRKTLKFDKAEQFNKAFVAPRTQEERQMAEIWADVLKLDNVGVDDNFFTIGGDSIKYLTVLSKVKKLGFSFTYQQLFEYPTIAGLVKQGILSNPIEENSRQPFTLLTPEDRKKIPEGVEDAYPLSVLQAGLIYQSEVQKGTALYFDVFSYRITGPFDKHLFTVAVKELTQRHDIIRTTYHLNGYSEYIQMVHSEAPVPLEVIDISSLDKTAQNKAIRDYVKSLRAAHIEWEKPGMVRFHIHILNENEYTYTVSFHDSALDGWSVNLLHTNLFETYYTLLSGNKQVRYDLPVKFKDFIELERQALNSEDSKAFWNRTLDGCLFTALPRWSLSTAETKVKLAYYEVKLPKRLSDNIKQLAKRLGVSVKSVLLAAHCRVLNILSGNEDVLTGYEISGRPEKAESEKVLGLFLNTIPFRVKCSGGTWADLIKDVHVTELELLPYRRYPMAHIKRQRGIQNQLFESVFNFTHFHVLKKLRELDNFQLVDVRMEAETEFAFRAEFSLHPFSDEVLLWLHYHANVFSSQQIEMASTYYVKALELMAEDEHALYHHQSLLSEQEVALQLEKFNSNKFLYPTESSFVQIFERQVVQTPEACAVRYQKSSWTYKELNAYANRVAHYLICNGLETEQVVAVSMQRTHMWMATLLGILKAGGAYMPIDPGWPEDRVCKIINKAEADFIITEQEPDKESFIQDIRTTSALQTVAYGTIIKQSTDTRNPQKEFKSQDLAYIIFTSGSTGEPKGAMIEHQGMLNHLYSKVNDLMLRKTDVIAQNASQCFDISVWQLLSGLMVGAQTVIYSNETILQIDTFISQVILDKITILEVVPSYLEMILHYSGQALAPLTEINYLLVTGEPLKSGLVNRWFNYYPGIPLVNAYGPTEASDDITHHFMFEPPKGNVVPVGRPIQNLNIYVVDRQKQLAPLGAKGEVFVSGIGVGRGYINDPEKTTAAFTTDCFIPSQDVRMYKTGDIGRWTPDGILELFGRVDDQIKLNGYRIELGEIEGQLQKMPGVREAAVVFNQRNSGKELIGFVVSSVHIPTDEFRSYLEGKLPNYMVPSSFVLLDQLPLTANGKTDKQKLFKLSESVKIVKAETIPLKGDEEIELAKAWEKVLGVNFLQIHANSNFFELGGHSLKAMELSVRTNKKYSINHILKNPVLTDMARGSSTKNSFNQELLVDFSQSIRKKKVSVICCTYAGGNAANFLPLFREMSKIDDAVGCYAIEFPRASKGGADSISVEETAMLCAGQVMELIDTPVVIWGHCSGAAVALELTRILEQRNFPVIKLFIGGKVIRNAVATKARSLVSSMLSPFMAVDAKKMTNNQIKKWMIEKSGFHEFETVGEKEAEVIIEAFRHDSVSANAYIKKATISGKVHVKAPIINVVAVDDLLTKNYKSQHKNWSLFSNRTKLIELRTGGHYFIKTCAFEVASLLGEELGLRKE